MNQPSQTPPAASVASARSELTAAGVVVLTVILHLLAGFGWAMGLLVAVVLGAGYLASFHITRASRR